MSWLADLLGYQKVLDSGNVEYPQRQKLRFLGATIADNPTLGTTDVTLAGGASLNPPGAADAGKIAIANVSQNLAYSGGSAQGQQLKWDITQGSVWTGGDLLISSFAATNPLVEIGVTVTNPTFTAVENYPPTLLKLTNTDNVENKDVTSTPTAFSSSQSYVKNISPGQNVTFTLRGDAPASPQAVKTATITWTQKNYHGVAAAGQSGASFILSLTGVLKTSRADNFTDTAGSTQKIYFACRTAYGTPTFSVGGFAGGFTKVGDFSVTNASGFTESFQLWESNNLGLGTTNVIVS